MASTREKIRQIIDLAAKQSTAGRGEVTQAVFDRARIVLEEICNFSDPSKALGIDCAECFANAAVATGVIYGARERLERLMRAEAAELPQTDAYVLVDLWGRAVGIEAMIGDLVKQFKKGLSGLGEAATKARMNAIFILLENTLAEICAEISRRGAIAAVGDALDNVATMIRAERRGPLAAALAGHLQDMAV